MADPVEIHRREVEQRVQIALSQGGWEGTHTDFKRELVSKQKDLAKLLKHILAFANTPRRTDAYIIFGVSEDKTEGVFSHVGAAEDGFPTSERIDDLVRQYTTLRDVFVDSHFVLEGKRTPYITVPIQYEGPHKMTRAFYGTFDPSEIFCRYGSSSVRATDRDVLRMQNSWETWFLDCRYEQNATSLMNSLAKRFPQRDSLVDSGSHVRLIYESVSSDEFGTQHVPVLVHAYSGFDPVEPIAIQRISDDKAQVFRKTVIGARFATNTLELAAQEAVRCVPLDEIYFVNDPYALLCREYLRQWDEDQLRGYLSFIVDLDFRSSESVSDNEVQRSILTFLERQLRETGRVAVLVHGDFGCGKTTTAKKLVADLCSEYLRKEGDVPKVLYVNVNNIDIRSRRDECIESQLSRSRLSRENIDRIVQMVRDDKIHLVFDGVDEMARPYTAAGRRSAIELLRDVGNRSAALYFVRSSYYAQLDEMINDFNLLSDHDFSTKQKRTVSVELLGLRKEQVVSYLESRLGSEEARQVRSSLHRMNLQSFLSDPLITSLLAALIENDGITNIESFPVMGQKAHFLGYLVEKLLEREQGKRSRHGALAENFYLFQQVLHSVAFSMVCRGSSTISPTQLEAFVQRATESANSSQETVDAFRTMSWIHRSDDGALSFRHESLTHVCAAEHIRTAFEHRDSRSLADWQPEAPLAGIVCDYAGESIDSVGLLGGTAMLGSELQFNVRKLITTVLSSAKGRNDLDRVQERNLDEHTIATICRGILSEPAMAQLPIRVLFRSLSEKRQTQIMIPLIWQFARKDLPESVAIAVFLLGTRIRSKWNFCDELEQAKKDSTSSLDQMLLRDLQMSSVELFDPINYEGLFNRMYADTSVDRATTQFADRTLKAIVGEKNRRQARLRNPARRH
jgi:Cdc6-like AAA superfamily ATPase